MYFIKLMSLNKNNMHNKINKNVIIALNTK